MDTPRKHHHVRDPVRNSLSREPTSRASARRTATDTKGHKTRWRRERPGPRKECGEFRSMDDKRPRGPIHGPTVFRVPRDLRASGGSPRAADRPREPKRPSAHTPTPKSPSPIVDPHGQQTRQMRARHHEIRMRISIDVEGEQNKADFANGDAERDRARSATQMNPDMVSASLGTSQGEIPSGISVEIGEDEIRKSHDGRFRRRRREGADRPDQTPRQQPSGQFGETRFHTPPVQAAHPGEMIKRDIRRVNFTILLFRPHIPVPPDSSSTRYSRDAPAALPTPAAEHRIGTLRSRSAHRPPAERCASS